MIFYERLKERSVEVVVDEFKILLRNIHKRKHEKINEYILGGKNYNQIAPKCKVVPYC